MLEFQAQLTALAYLRCSSLAHRARPHHNRVFNSGLRRMCQEHPSFPRPIFVCVCICVYLCVFVCVRACTEMAVKATAMAQQPAPRLRSAMAGWRHLCCPMAREVPPRGSSYNPKGSGQEKMTEILKTHGCFLKSPSFLCSQIGHKA